MRGTFFYTTDVCETHVCDIDLIVSSLVGFLRDSICFLSNVKLFFFLHFLVFNSIMYSRMHC